MKTTRNRIILELATALTALFVLVTGPSMAADFPARPVQLMVAYPAGGSTDVAARIVAAIAEKQLGQTIVVVNRGGAGGQVGWTDMSRARPDGYYMGFINLPALNTVILDPERKAAFKADAFVPLINQVLDPGIIWIKADSPYKSLKDLLEAAKRAPNKISAATTGILSDDHLAILMAEEAYPGAIFRIVHLEGGAAQLTAILGGHIDVAFDNVGSVYRRVRTGELRALAVMDTRRSSFLPDVPTTPELGFPTVISNSTRGIAVPKGTPAPIIKKLEQVFKKAMEDPEHVKKMEEAGLALKIMVGEEYAKYYRELHAKAAKYTDWARNRPHK
jgi:tripartite-type tricarboxylate transporter receptor subunit TctC